MIKAYLLKDNITNLDMLFTCADDSNDFHHADSELHEGYFVDKQDMANIFKAGMAYMMHQGKDLNGWLKEYLGND